MTRTKEDLIENRHSLTSLEMRTLNRYYLHPDNQRCCSECFVIYSDYTKHFHIKKKYDTGTIGYNVKCATCFNATNRKRISKLRKSPHDFIRARFTSYLHRAKHDQCAFDLTPEFLIQLWDYQEGKCFYINEKICFTYTTESQKHPHLQTPSLDRVDPKKGYTQGNVVWCAYGINRMKNDLDLTTFKTACEVVLATLKERGYE